MSGLNIEYPSDYSISGEDLVKISKSLNGVANPENGGIKIICHSFPKVDLYVSKNGEKYKPKRIEFDEDSQRYFKSDKFHLALLVMNIKKDSEKELPEAKYIFDDGEIVTKADLDKTFKSFDELVKTISNTPDIGSHGGVIECIETGRGNNSGGVVSCQDPYNNEQ